MKRLHIYYSGIVQGVGFRYTVQHMVSKLGDLSGWVRNLPDGRVEILMEGEQELLENFMMNIEKRFEGSIRNKKMEYIESQGAFSDFRIIF